MNKVTADLDMSFASFVEHYTEDLKTRLKENTWSTKDHIIRTKLIPYFGKLKMCAVTPQIVMTWQNEMLRFRDKDGKPYSPVYLRTVQNQELLCKGWLLPPNTYDCGSFVVNGKAVIGK